MLVTLTGMHCECLRIDLDHRKIEAPTARRPYLYEHLTEEGAGVLNAVGPQSMNCVTTGSEANKCSRLCRQIHAGLICRRPGGSLIVHMAIGPEMGRKILRGLPASSAWERQFER